MSKCKFFSLILLLLSLSFSSSELSGVMGQSFPRPCFDGCTQGTPLKGTPSCVLLILFV